MRRWGSHRFKRDTSGGASLGMLAWTAVCVYSGSSVPASLALANDEINAVFLPAQSTQIINAFALLGIFALILRWSIKLFTTRNAVDNVAEASLSSGQNELTV